MQSLRDFIGDILLGIAGFLVAFLPSRVWQRFDNLPIYRMILPAAIVTLLAGGGIQIWNYLEYIKNASAAFTGSAWKVIEGQQAAGPYGQPIPNELTTAHLTVGLLPAVFYVALCTPWGLLATYLTLSGVVRFLAWIASDPMGDPALTGLGALWRWDRKRARSYRAEARRRRAEGPEKPDRLIPGVNAGLADVDVVVIASRRKHGWDTGAIVMTDGAWYRLAEPYDLILPEGLRTIYPLTDIPMVEVVRRGVIYKLPILDPSFRLPRR